MEKHCIDDINLIFEFNPKRSADECISMGCTATQTGYRVMHLSISDGAGGEALVRLFPDEAIRLAEGISLLARMVQDVNGGHR